MASIIGYFMFSTFPILLAADVVLLERSLPPQMDMEDQTWLTSRIRIRSLATAKWSTHWPAQRLVKEQKFSSKADDWNPHIKIYTQHG